RSAADGPWSLLPAEERAEVRAVHGHGRVLGRRPVAKGDDPVRGGGDAFVMGDEYEGLSGGPQVGEEAEDVVGRGGVEIAGGFVGEDHERLVDQGAGDGDPLPLPSGQLGRQVPAPVRESDAVEKGGGALAGGARRVTGE